MDSSVGLSLTSGQGGLSVVISMTQFSGGFSQLGLLMFSVYVVINPLLAKKAFMWFAISVSGIEMLLSLCREILELVFVPFLLGMMSFRVCQLQELVLFPSLLLNWSCMHSAFAFLTLKFSSFT